MKHTPIILFALSLCACVTDDSPAPIIYPDATYCIAHLEDVKPAGLFDGPCATTVSIEMLCTQHDDENQTFDSMLVTWESRQAGAVAATGAVGLTYRCNQVQTVTIYGTACEGSPFTVAAGFYHPTLGAAPEGQAYVCADAAEVTP